MKQLLIICLVFIGCAAAYPGRIVGGQNTTIDKRPYQASVQLKTIFDTYYLLCGASIISTRHLLTSANCNPGPLYDFLFVRVGSSTLDIDGQLFKIANFIAHPSYVSSTLDYDFAILTLYPGEEIILGPQVQIIALPSAGQDPEVGSMATVSGWGVLAMHDEVPAPILQEVDMPVWNNNECSVVYYFLSANQICLGGTETDGTSSCFGDNGGPMVQGDPPVQYGTVSGGDNCYGPNIPGIYGRVSTVRDWINAVTGV